jgi:hypothetical protein
MEGTARGIEELPYTARRVCLLALALLQADAQNALIRRIVVSSALVTTLAGQGGVTGSANGAGTVATFNNPTAVAVDGSGTLAVVVRAAEQRSK